MTMMEANTDSVLWWPPIIPNHLRINIVLVNCLSSYSISENMQESKTIFHIFGKLLDGEKMKIGKAEIY